jgi:penicillin-binding protein 2
LGGAALLEMARQFGFGAATRIAVDHEAAGQLPTDEQLRSLELLRYLTVGQGGVTATPLQVVRFYAALANGGYLVEPRLTRDRVVSAAAPHAAPSDVRGRKISGLSPATLTAVRSGLERVVADPSGTAYGTVRIASLAIAGKTGTAETGAQQGDHAWFAGYAPCDAPRVAFVVVIEHGGSGATVAGPVAKSLVQAMQQLGYFAQGPVAENPAVRR